MYPKAEPSGVHTGVFESQWLQLAPPIPSAGNEGAVSIAWLHSDEA